MLLKLAIRLFGKKVLDGAIEKFGLSKAKVAAWLMFGLPAIEAVSALVGHPVKIVTPEVKMMLEGAGLWAIRDAINS